LKQLALYVVLGLAIVGGAVVFGVFTPDQLFPTRAWFTFIFATGFLCLFVSKMYWSHRKSRKLWALLALLLIAHVALYKLVLEHFPQFPSILFLVTVPLEIMLAATIVKVCLNVMPGKVKL